jgi:hypothetical protein
MGKQLARLVKQMLLEQDSLLMSHNIAQVYQITFTMD